MKNRKGFTLVELIGVIVILGIVLGLVSIAFVSINNHIKTTYYKEIETVLLQTAGEYYTYNQGEAPKVFGSNAEVSIETLVNGKYVEEVKDRNGNDCTGSVVAYKNSYDRTNYYVCLKCSDYETDNAACRGEVDYSLQMTATISDTTTLYQEGSFVKDYVTLTFRTFNDVKEIHIEDENGEEVKTCNFEIENDIASCKIQIDQSGEYTAYGTSENGAKTDEKEIAIKIDKQSPSFDIYENGVLITDNQSKDATNGNIDLEINVLNIKDLESGIKSIRYSFEKDEANFQTVTTPREEFTIAKNLEIGKYTLIVEIEDNVGNKETKTIEYEVYERVSIPIGDVYCNDLTYNGEEQELTKTAGTGFTFINNRGTNAGSYTVRARLNENYHWSDGTNTDKTFTCEIKKATPTLTLSATSGTVNPGLTVTFTERANVAGSFTNISSNTSVATVSPASLTNVTANTARTVTVTGVSHGTSTITVTFTPTDTTNYNTRTATYTVTGYYNEATVGSCNNLTYNGVSQTLASGGDNVTYKNAYGTNAGSYTVTVTALSGYRFSDNTTTKTLNCTINKKSVAVSWGSTTTFTYNGLAQAPSASASSGVSGETLNITRTAGRNAGSYTSTATISSVTGGQGLTSNYTLTGATKAFTIRKATPTLTLSATSGSVDADATITFTERANVAGSFTNISSNTSVATVSPASLTNVAANTARTVTITGVSHGTSTITVTFKPTDTTNYNTRTATYTVTGSYKEATVGSCNNLTYNGVSQTLASGGDNVTYKNAYGTNAGSYTVTVTALSGYRFSDNTTTKTLNCTINKKSVAVSWGSTTTFTYNGLAQAPSASASSGVSGETLNITRTAGRNAGSYTSTATISSVTGGQGLTSNYTLTGATKAFTIRKATPTLTLSATSGRVYAGATSSFTVQASVAGNFSNVSRSTSIATVSPASLINVAANTARTVTITGVNSGNTTITVTFTPTDTTNYNTRTATYTVIANLVSYSVKHYQMNNDGTNYTLVSTIYGSGKVGQTVTGKVNTYANFSSPSAKSITLTSNSSNNVISYYYTRTCYGSTCDYCSQGSPLGECLIENASTIGLWQSGLSQEDVDTYRFIGTTSDQPKNYICFGTKTDCTGNNFLHRIIGVFGSEHQVRLIKATSSGTTYFNRGAMSTASYNNSNLRSTIEAIANSSTFGWTSIINGTTKWSDIVVTRPVGYFVSASVYTTSASTSLNAERVVSSYFGLRNAKIFPIAISDLLLSTGSTSLNFKNNYATIDSSWMALQASEWTFHLRNTTRAWVINGTGRLCNGESSLDSYCSTSGYFSSGSSYVHNYRANFQLSENALFCGGSGTSTDPYIIGYGSC